MDSDSCSLSSVPSSPLSEPVYYSSPPPQSYPSPPSSQDSSDADSPCPSGMESADRVSGADGPPPKKKRRVSERKPRTTERLNLSRDEVDEDEQEQLNRLVDVLRNRRKIVVVAGAGISVSANIPDFRSSKGLFKTLRAEYNLKGSGKDLFDASVYNDDLSTASFHDMIRRMTNLTRDAQPTKFHHLLATLAKEDRLLRLYTQNVDGLDVGLEPLATTVPLAKVNGKWPKTIQLHGGLAKMVCSKCKVLHDMVPDLFIGAEPPVCQVCVDQEHVRTKHAFKRSHGIGRMRPRMVLYNEHNPDEEAIGKVVSEDLRKRPDAVIVIGTSLKIPGVKRIVREMCATVRDRRDGVAVWINNDPEPVGVEFKDCWDIVVKGQSDRIATETCLERWDEPQDFTQAEFEAAKKVEVQIRVSPAFKRIDSESEYRNPSSSPDFSPRRIFSVTDDLPTDDDVCAFAPPTPCKSVKNSPSRKVSPKKAFSAFKALEPKPEKKKPGRPKGSVSARSSKQHAQPKKGPKKGKAGDGVGTTIKLNQMLSQTKTAKPGRKRKGVDVEKDQIMQRVPSKDARLNSLSEVKTPSKLRTSMFPNLGESPKKMADIGANTQIQTVERPSRPQPYRRISIESICS